jgi:hypothetical protein
VLYPGASQHNSLCKTARILKHYRGNGTPRVEWLFKVRAKAALLSGPERARRWIPRGGVVVLDDRSVEVIEP